MSEPQGPELYEASLPQWQLLTQEEQEAYANAHLLERSKALLGFAAISGEAYGQALQVSPEGLRAQLLRMPLTEVSSVATMMGEIGKKLGVSAFKAPEMVPVVQVQQTSVETPTLELPASTEPIEVPETIVEPPEAEAVTVPEEVEEIEDDGTPINRNQKFWLVGLYGPDFMATALRNGLTFARAERVIAELMPMYLANNKRRVDALKQVERLGKYTQGASFDEIGQAEGIQGNSVEAAIRHMRTILARSYSEQQLQAVVNKYLPKAQSQAQQVASPKVEVPAQAVTQDAPARPHVVPAEAVEEPESQERLLIDAALEFMDGRGMPHRLKVALLERLDTEQAHLLTQDGVEALEEVAAMYKEAYNRGYEFSDAEVQVIKWFLAHGVPQGQRPLPLIFIKQKCHAALSREDKEITTVFIDIFGKFNDCLRTPHHGDLRAVN